jgi:hypothetical protein
VLFTHIRNKNILDRVLTRTNINPHFRRNAVCYGCRTHKTDTEDSDTTTSSGRKPNYLPFSVQLATVRELFDRSLHFTWRSAHVYPRIKDFSPTLRQIFIKTKGGFRQKLHSAIIRAFILFINFVIIVRVLKHRNKINRYAVTTFLQNCWTDTVTLCSRASNTGLCFRHFGVLEN